jgi:hypothetical protein
MLYGNPTLFALARNAKLGLCRLDTGLSELREWIVAEFSVGIVHIVLDHIEAGPAKGRPRVNLILETDKDFDVFTSGLPWIQPALRDRVKRRLTQLAADHPELDCGHAHVTLDNFSEGCLANACTAFLKVDASQLCQDFKQTLWRIDGFGRGLVAFLYTDEEVAVSESAQTAQSIRERCFSALKKHDEFGYLTASSFRFKFDSKQNLDANYHGNLFHYWR